MGCWHGYLSGVQCRLAYGPADAVALTISCFSKIQIGFTFLVPAHPGSPGQKAVKRVCVCVRGCVCIDSNSSRVPFAKLPRYCNIVMMLLTFLYVASTALLTLEISYFVATY